MNLLASVVIFLGIAFGINNQRVTVVDPNERVTVVDPNERVTVVDPNE